MKLYSQQGHSDGDKSRNGLEEGTIQGVVFSPRDLLPDSLRSRADELSRLSPSADLLLDPQFYVSLYGDQPNARLGKLPEWPFFEVCRRSQLEASREVDRVLRAVLTVQQSLPLTALVAPGVFIPQSFNSIEAVIAKNFVRQARSVYAAMRDSRPLLATLAISRDALLQRHEFEAFLNDITLLDAPPDGFYLVVGGRSSEARGDLYHADVIAGWMMLNQTLTVNGYTVVNGYSDFLTPFLGASGGHAGCTGWWTNLRLFSLDRFVPEAEGGRLPIVRYASKLLLNRVRFDEKEALSPFLPGVVNGLPHDADYNPEPARSSEVLQAWEAIASLTGELVADGEGTEALERCEAAVRRAAESYAQIATIGLPLDRKSDDTHVEPLQDGLRRFRKWAGL